LANKIKTVLISIQKKLSDKRFLSIALIAVFIIACVAYFVKDYFITPGKMLLPNVDSIEFSVDSGFYNESVTVDISVSGEVPLFAKLCYSLDGSDPEEKYSEPITLEYVEGETRIYVVKAAVRFFGQFSGAVSRTYMIGGEALDMDFISITADEESLHDYETGIFEAGKTYDDNIARGAEGYVYGNYSMRGKDWIRDCWFTMIDCDGNLLVNQQTGLEVAGGTSAAYPVKSLRIIGQNEYADYGKITLDLSCENISDLSLNNSNNSIRLRSGSQDTDVGNIRSAVVSRLASQSGFNGCVGTRRALVYVNGSLYGIFDIQQNLTESFLRQRFSLPDSDNIRRIETNEENAFLIHTDLIKYFDADLTVKENREDLEKHVDLDNYFTYYAVECLVGNSDWPDNNVKMWAYTGGYDGVNPYTDGRYRFLIFDTDLTYYTHADYEWVEGCLEDTLTSIMEHAVRGKGSQLPKLMKSQEYKQRFLTVLSDMLEGAFSTENVMKVIDEETAKVDAAYNKYFSENVNARRLQGLENMKLSASEREGVIREDVEKYFGSTGTYKLNINKSEGVSLKWINKTVYPNESYACDYFSEAAFEIKAEASPDYEFEYFILNGERIDGETVRISKEKAVYGEITLEAVCKKKQGAVLVIEEFAAKRDDWIRLKNIGEEAVLLSDYYISDSEKEYMLYQLPKVELKAGESITIYCKDNNFALSEYICNFKLGDGEVLYLYDSVKGEICDSVFVPNMGLNETYRRFNESSIFKFCKNEGNK